jgi:hypothetical protein
MDVFAAIRGVVVPVAVVMLAAALTPSAAAEPPPTQVITAAPVGPNGEPVNGYQEVPPAGNVTTVSECTTPSLSAVADDIYSCSPSAAGADTCWPSTPESLLCLDDPWNKQLHRVAYAGPHVQPPAITDPIAVLLDDGTRCRLRNGGAWGGRDDGYVGVYSAAAPTQTLPSCGSRAKGPEPASIGPLRSGQSRSANSAHRPSIFRHRRRTP